MKSIIHQFVMVIALLGGAHTTYAASISTQVGCSLNHRGYGEVNSIDCGKVYLEKAFGIFKYGDSHASINADYGELHAYADAQTSLDSANAGFAADMHDTLVFKHPTAKSVVVTVKLWLEGNTFASDSSIPSGEVFPHASASAYAQFTASADFQRNNSVAVQLFAGDTPPRRGAPNAMETLTFTVPVDRNVGWYLHLEGGAAANSYVDDPSKAITMYKSFIDMQNTAWLQLSVDDPLTTFISESGSRYSGRLVVPEPATYAMMGLGIALFAWKRRKLNAEC